MKIAVTLLILTTLLFSNDIYAQQNHLQASCGGSCVKKSADKQASELRKGPKEQPAPKANRELAWGIGLCGLIVIGAVAGITAGMASQSN